ncbi:DEAD/DEAH box helicase family protein, partial [Candidatus Saccharibacteria bacterium]|nr:DEAD/DEAH box helicase family protein [Candidatus Saccharibacteria bacterium]
MNVNAYKPRIYQKNCLDALQSARDQGKSKALVVMASGLGKTLTGA